MGSKTSITSRIHSRVTIMTKLTRVLIVFMYFDAALCDNLQNAIEKSSVIPVQMKVHTCCDLDLNSTEPVQCKKRTPEEGLMIPSGSLTVPAHLMAENQTFIIRLDTKAAPCPATDTNSVYLPWSFSTGRGSLLLRNGYLKVETEYYHMDEYCINGKNETTLEIHVCPQDCRGPRPCIQKCCGLDKVYSFGFSKNGIGIGCQNPGTAEYFKPTLYSDFMQASSNTEALAPHYIEKYPKIFKYKCHENRTSFSVFPKVSKVIREYTGHNLTGMTFRLREDGKILYREPDGKCSAVDPESVNICIDGIINYAEKSHPYLNDPEELVIFMCSLPPPEGHEKHGGFLYGGLMIASSIFLLLTIAVYGLLWERQTVHGWTILSHTICLFFMYIFLGTAHLIRVTQQHDTLNKTGCFALGVLAHFFFLATFCWLSIISLDLWLTFRAITPRRGTQSKGLGRYIKYSIIGWGVPLVIVAVGWILSTEHQENTCSTSTVLTPAYGVYSCYLQEKAFGPYLYYPMTVMMLINFTLFGITSVKLYMYQNSTKLATKDENQQQFYRLFFKLFFVMGVLYVFEILSWILSGSGFFWYWVVFDILNILRAVAVFVIFVLKPDILWALEQNYPWLKPVMIPFSCCLNEKRSFAQRTAESESVGLNSSLSTKNSTIRSTTT